MNYGIADQSAPEVKTLLGGIEQQTKSLRASGLFDVRYYVSNSADINFSDIDPLDHFLTIGWREGRKPNFYFECDWYLANNPEALPFGKAAIFHYVLSGDFSGKSPSRLFLTSWYRKHYAISASENALAHFLNHAKAQKFSPLPWFDIEEYLLKHSDVATAGVDPFEHFINFGRFEGRQPNSSFGIYDSAAYIDLSKVDESSLLDFMSRQHNSLPKNSSAEVAMLNVDAAREGSTSSATQNELISSSASMDVQTGQRADPKVDKHVEGKIKNSKPVDWREFGRRYFDANWYCNQNVAIKNQSEAFDHWWNVGRRMGLSPNPLFDHDFYAQQIRSVAKVENQDLFLRFLHLGAKEDHDPHPCFSNQWYRSQYSDRELDHPWMDYQENGFRERRNPNWLFSHRHLVERGLADDGDARPLLTKFLLDLDSGENSPHPLLDILLVRKHNNDISSDSAYLSFWQAYRKRDIRTHIYFDPAFYRTQIQERKIIGRSLVDYIQHGEAENRQPNPLFVPDWHRKHYGCDNSFESVLEEFVSVGERLYRHPCPGFDPRFYLEMHQDVARAGQNPLRHFITSGQRELRKIHRRFDLPWYAAQIAEEHKERALEFWLHTGRFQGHAPHPCVSVDFRGNRAEALVAFLEPTPGRSSVISGLHVALDGNHIHKQQNIGPAVFGQAWLVDEFEKSHRRKGKRDAELLKRNEPIVRQFETFDDIQAKNYANAIREAFASTGGDLPLVSVVIPTRNRVRVIKRAIRSVLSQTHQNIELLVVDDGSLDNTDQLINRHFSDPRVKHIPIPASGVSAARNIGIEHAKGDYIAYCDSDNYWEPLHLEIVIKALILEKASAGYSVLRVFNEKNIFRYRGDVYNEDAMDRENYIDMNVYVHHRSITDAGLRFDENLKRCVDWDFILRASKKNKPFFVPVIGCDYVDDNGALERITTDELSGDFYRVCQRGINLKPHTVGFAPQKQCRSTIVWPISAAEWEWAHDKLWKVVEHCMNHDDELIIINNGMGFAATNFLATLGEMTRHVRVVNLWRTFKVFPAVNLASKIAKGKHLLVWNSSISFDSSKVNCFIDQAITSGAAVSAPLVLNEFGKICNYLAIPETTSHVLTPILTGNTPNDYAGEIRGVAAIDSPVLINKTKFVNSGGFSPGFAVTFGLADLCLRFQQNSPNSTVVFLDTHFSTAKSLPSPTTNGEYQKELDLFKEKWMGQTFISPKLPNGFSFGQHGRVSLLNRSWELFPDLDVGLPIYAPSIKKSFRFVLRCPAPDTIEKVSWGDYHYALAMKAALEKFGHQAVLEYSGNWKNPVEKGDVYFHIRGIVDIKPVSGALNAMWIISHPEKVSALEYGSTDVIFAAGSGVKDSLRQTYGRDSHLLLQATDQTRFCGEITNIARLKDKALFVGNSRLQMRPIVLDSISAGLPIVVYGKNWETLIPEKYISGTYLANEGLANWYGSSAVVLNDHWPTMREYGIISNRIFDVVATGRPVITDYIGGIKDIFGDSVATYEYEEELPGLFDHMSSGNYLDAAKLVRSNHTIEKRVEEIMRVLSVGKR